MKFYAVALISGIIFAIGLAVGGMTQPGKVVGFLDITGNWDPSLMLVMAGAMAVYFPVHRMVRKLARPVFAEGFRLPTRRDINPRLVGGAALFGVGWALAGYCPGPALTTLGSMAQSAVIFVPAMFVGFAAVAWFDRRKS